MLKKLLSLAILFFTISSFAQEGTASPYSFYGIGSQKFKGTVENRSMGGLSIYTDSIHMNLRNPASYAGNNLATFNDESRPVKFTVGGSTTSTTLKNETSSDKVSSSTFDYLALSIPLGKFGVGFGLLPYTAVGYKLENSNALGNISNRYTGEGGLNKVFLSAGYQITKDLSFGVDANYNFGNIQNSAINFVYNDEDELVQYQSRETNRSDLSGLNVNFGLHYQTMVSSKLELVSALTYSPTSDLKSENERQFSTITISTTDIEYEINTIDGELTNSTLTLPSSFSFGAGLGEPRKWFAGIEHTSTQTSDFANNSYTSAGATYENSNKTSIGGFYIPKYNSFSKYWERITYRAGVRFENTGLKINDEAINEFGMSFGVGLPVGNMFSNANLGFEFGNRGTTNANLIKENFVNFQLSLSLNDRWFQKRKFN